MNNKRKSKWKKWIKWKSTKILILSIWKVNLLKQLSCSSPLPSPVLSSNTQKLTDLSQKIHNNLLFNNAFHLDSEWIFFKGLPLFYQQRTEKLTQHSALRKCINRFTDNTRSQQERSHDLSFQFTVLNITFIHWLLHLFIKTDWEFATGQALGNALAVQWWAKQRQFLAVLL